MSVVLHISDPHFGTEKVGVIEALVNLTHSQQPDMVVLSGDITQRARQSQFRAASRFVKRLAAPVLVLPGNHDIPLFNIIARLFFPYANYQREFGIDLEPNFASEDLLIIGVNTTRPYRHIDGEVSLQQIQRVVTHLHTATPRQLRIVVTHQPVSVIRRQDKANLLHGYRQAIYSWSQAGADLILGGHIHLPYISPLRLHFADLSRNVWIVQAGTSVSTRTRWGTSNSVNMIRYVPTQSLRQCVVERWDYKVSSGCFHIAQSQEIHLSENDVTLLI